MFDAGVEADKRVPRGRRVEAEQLVRLALERQEASRLAERARDLVHDPAGGADDAVLDYLAEAGKTHRIELDVVSGANGTHGGDLDGGGGGDAGAERDAALDEQVGAVGEARGLVFGEEDVE